MLRLANIALLTFGCACCLAGQPGEPGTLKPGAILITPREAPDPLFAKSVIVLVRYEKTGTLGLIVNKPSEVSVSRVLRNIQGAAARSDAVYVGGPVEMDTVFALARATKNPEGATQVIGRLSFISAKPALEKALGASAPNDLRVYAGYCGWSPGQLENEMRLHGWYVLPPDDQIPFDPQPATLWSRLVDRMEGHVARLQFLLAGMR